jgi:hypothetical protein
MIGGATGNGVLDDVWQIDIETCQWSQERTGGAAPGARAYASVTGSPDGIILIGGTDGVNALPDAFKLSPNGTWTRHAGPALFAHSSTLVGPTLVVHGGHNGVGFTNQTRILNLSRMEWLNGLTVFGHAKPRGYHAGIYHDSRIVVLGGLATPLPIERCELGPYAFFDTQLSVQWSQK